MTRSSTMFLADIVENMHDTIQFVKGLSIDEFRKNKMVINAVLRSIEVMGEASKCIPDTIRNRRPDIPWRNMARMRDRLIHGYFGIDYARVWETAKKAIPDVLPKVESLLEEIRAEEQEKG